MILALEQLKSNEYYKVLTNELERIKGNIELSIFNENISIDKKPALIAKRNTIQNFIELPDDLIQEETIKESNSAPAPNLG
jgi:hypothetical protein